MQNITEVLFNYRTYIIEKIFLKPWESVRNVYSLIIFWTIMTRFTKYNKKRELETPLSCCKKLPDNQNHFFLSMLLLSSIGYLRDTTQVFSYGVTYK